ncbi:MAG: cytochrome P450 [Actinomycetota bacterium]
MELLGQHPDVLSQVRADRALLPNLLEEALRLSSPVLFLFRHTPEPVELAGAVVPNGAMVAALYASANRDPDVFEDPESFCLGRVNADRHVAFGSGIHFCVGSALARAEAYACASSLLDRFSGIQLGKVQAGDDTGGIKLRSRKHLHVTFV